MLTQDDLHLIQAKAISARQIYDQLEQFEKGFPYLPVIASASIEKGIKCIAEDEQAIYLEKWFAYLEQNKQIVKFVPASGAASRMFKDLFEFLSSSRTVPSTPFEQTFFEGIRQFAFFPALDQCCLLNEKNSIDQLMAEGKYKSVVENLLLPKGLNYGQLPKGLILFHAYPEGARTAMEEHWVEGARYACNQSRKVILHFTVSPEHRSLFESLTKEKIPAYARQFEVDYEVDFSEQKPSTDTVAVDMENQLFRENGQLVFRPGGHGALIENLNDLSADIVFIKNIDNVVPDSFKPITIRYKQLIAGILVKYQQQIFTYLEKIDSGTYTHEELMEMLYFLQNELCIKNLGTKVLEDGELVLYIRSRLNRPLRVCGMVRNQGEPGGGPFLTVNSDGTVSLQILESSQIDLKNPKMKAFFEEGTHFNPVDLVCALKDYKGRKFNLTHYVDKNTGFISLKSKNGKTLKALELPGLWNGAMSNWNTLFVEVPIETFNPVKTVNDLLRPEHQ
ncbi:MAG: DUF4301 family protein [Candidatus Azobacteroides sp.]|nr:DUF4301 family protein [Candidatus Azobacteroides sp.]